MTASKTSACSVLSRHFRTSGGRRGWRVCLLGLGLSSIFGLTGCQIDVGGQTLPSPWYLQDDVQYFPPGTQFPLSREANAQKAVSQESAQMR